MPLRAIADEGFATATQEQIQSEVDELLELDHRDPTGTAHVAESILRRFPGTPQNLLTQVAVLEGTVVRQRTLIEVIFWVSAGSLLFRLLRAFPSNPPLSGHEGQDDPLTRKLPTGPRTF